MKILAITSRYPPYHLGGYEIRCNNILDELAYRGHKILVITSVKETQSKQSGQVVKYKIFRKLHIRKRARHFIDELVIDLRDTAFLARQIQRYRPDVIYLGHIMPMSKAIMPLLAECKIPIIYDEGGMGLIDSWGNRGRWFYFIDEYISRYSILNKIKPMVINTICKISGNRIKSKWNWPENMQIIFNSELNLKNTISKRVPINTARVIHSGVDTGGFSFILKTNLAPSPLFIVPGRIEPLKGQIDAVRLLAKLRDCDINGNMIIIGKKHSLAYYLEIENEIKKFHLEGKIIFKPMVPQDQLIDLYHQTDICFFPSYHKTGYSRVPLEAMACGCIVISYGNEGSDEIIRNGQTGFLIPSGDYGAMVDTIKELASNPKRVIEIACAARKEVEDNCSMQKYVDNIEEFVINAVGIL